jgi:hypothetical protein
MFGANFVVVWISLTIQWIVPNEYAIFEWLHFFPHKVECLPRKIFGYLTPKMTIRQMFLLVEMPRELS